MNNAVCVAVEKVKPYKNTLKVYSKNKLKKTEIYLHSLFSKKSQLHKGVKQKKVEKPKMKVLKAVR